MYLYFFICIWIEIWKSNVIEFGQVVFVFDITMCTGTQRWFGQLKRVDISGSTQPPQITVFQCAIISPSFSVVSIESRSLQTLLHPFLSPSALNDMPSLHLHLPLSQCRCYCPSDEMMNGFRWWTTFIIYLLLLLLWYVKYNPFVNHI